MITIREATVNDAARASKVLCASITDLCAPDHRRDANVIERWTRNKTPAAFRARITTSSDALYVAEVNGVIVAIGGVDENSSITLNYVVPDHRLQGISKAMLHHLEQTLYRKGVRRACLTSTLTARDFYSAAGWTETGETESFIGTRAFTFEKILDD